MATLMGEEEIIGERGLMFQREGGREGAV